uniref:Uncharacterized protein n=1 Tax=Leersia perrieri TaxID=77586 RepID=A0A0D9WQM7_9ORYZ
MADPAEETVPAPPPTPAVPAEGSSDSPPADAAASPEKVTPPEPAPEPAPAVRSRGFRLLGEDTSVHKVLGGGKTMLFNLVEFIPLVCAALILKWKRWKRCGA